MGKKVIIALGGNAILQRGDKGTIAEQTVRLRSSCKYLAKIAHAGHNIVITHGNGPQVGDILLRGELAAHQLPVPALDICGAESQGMLGYLIQRVMGNQLKKDGMDKRVITIVTQTLVDRKDPAFKNPTKPVGEYFTKEQAAALEKDRGWRLAEEPGKGWRRVVPSPHPVATIEGRSIKRLFNEGFIVIAGGGGGIPVIYDKQGILEGVEGVIDKDLTAAVLGRRIAADILLMLTDVEYVAINYGKPNQKDLKRISVDEAKKYLAEGQFPNGTMGPKIDAAIKFVEEGGEKAIIAPLEKAKWALEGKAGTEIS